MKLQTTRGTPLSALSADVRRTAVCTATRPAGFISILSVVCWITLSVSGCGTESTSLSFTSSEFHADFGEPGAPKGYARVHIVYPHAGGAEPADSLNFIITSHITRELASYVREDTDGDSFDDFSRAFIDEYRQFKTSFPDAPYEWTIDITGEVSFHSSDLVSLVFTTEAYPGGAHPLTTMQSINLSLPSCILLALHDVADDTTGVARLAEQLFRDDRQLAPDDDFADAGFWFPGNRFSLPRTWYLSDTALYFHYNPYEIAPYAFGSFDIRIPRTLLQKLHQQDR